MIPLPLLLCDRMAVTLIDMLVFIDIEIYIFFKKIKTFIISYIYH